MPPRPDPRAVDPCPAIQWIGWHLGELAAVAVPTVLALTVWPWFGVLAVLAAAAWIGHEIRLYRRRRALAAAWTRHAVTGSPATTHDGQASA